jgi:hypothetical protein
MAAAPNEHGGRSKRTLALVGAIFSLGAFLSWAVAAHPRVRAGLAVEVHKAALQLGLAANTEPVPAPVPKPVRKPSPPHAVVTRRPSPPPPAAKQTWEAEAVVGNRRVPLQSNAKQIVIVNTQPGAPDPAINPHP